MHVQILAKVAEFMATKGAVNHIKEQNLLAGITVVRPQQEELMALMQEKRLVSVGYEFFPLAASFSMCCKFSSSTESKSVSAVTSDCNTQEQHKAGRTAPFYSYGLCADMLCVLMLNTGGGPGSTRRGEIHGCLAGSASALQVGFGQSTFCFFLKLKT